MPPVRQTGGLAAPGAGPSGTGSPGTGSSGLALYQRVIFHYSPSRRRYGRL